MERLLEALELCVGRVRSENLTHLLDPFMTAITAAMSNILRGNVVDVCRGGFAFVASHTFTSLNIRENWNINTHR